MAAAPQRKLGRGLSALISETYPQPVPPTKATAKTRVKVEAVEVEEITPQVSNGLETVAVSKLHAGKYQPRTQFTESNLSELAESIRKNGIMQPIVVRASETQSGKYEIIAGERRWRAAKQAGLDEVPVLIRDITDKQALELALVENIQRQDLSPLEEANAYQRLIEEFEYTQEELAGTVGKSRSHVANLLRLLSLPDEVKEMLERCELTMGHARALLTASNPVELAREIVSKGLNVRQAEQYGRKSNTPRKKSGPRAANQTAQSANPNKDPDIIALEETLSENLGLKVSINDRGQSGEIIIAYDSLSQLDEILRRLGDGI